MKLALVSSCLVFLCQPFLFGVLGEEKGQECYCGLTKKTEVINGTDVTDMSKYPFLVGILSKKSEDKLCTGALISLTTILTAAHCSEDENAEAVIVAFIGLNGQLRKRIDVKKITNHPEYDKSEGPVARHDIAVWKLAKAVVCQPGSIPICIPTQEMGTPGITTHIAGIGYSVEEPPHDPIPIMKEGRAQMRRSDDCILHDKPEESVYCVVGIDGTTPCQGDSGSSLFMKKDEIFYTLGPLSGSVGGGCSQRARKLYTSVFYYRKWIEEEVEDLAKPKEGKITPQFGGGGGGFFTNILKVFRPSAWM